MTPTDKAAIEGLIKLAQEITYADAFSMPTDTDLKGLGYQLLQNLEALQSLLAGETREAVIADAREYEKQHEAAEQSTIKFVKDYIKTLPHTEAVSECLHCSLNYLVSRFIDKHRAFDALLSSPSPHDDAGADKPAGVPVVELEKLASDWNMDYENNPGLLSPDDCADELLALARRKT